MEGEETFIDVDWIREIVKLEQFINGMPTEIHRWVQSRLLFTTAHLKM